MTLYLLLETKKLTKHLSKIGKAPQLGSTYFSLVGLIPLLIASSIFRLQGIATPSANLQHEPTTQVESSHSASENIGSSEDNKNIDEESVDTNDSVQEESSTSAKETTNSQEEQNQASPAAKSLEKKSVSSDESPHQNTLDALKFFKDNFNLSLPIYISNPVVLNIQDNLSLEMSLIDAKNSTTELVDYNKVVYKDALTHTDVEYQTQENKLKESIILKEKNHPKEFSFNFNFEDFDYTLYETGKIDFFKKSKNKDPLFKLFTLPSPFMVDDEGNESDDMEVKIENDQLILTPNQNWLSDATYPVTIDPTIEINILNVHSHPVAGEYWEVNFTTLGTANLKITPADQATIEDMEFDSLKCGDEEREVEILEGDVIYYPDWFCDEIATVSHLDLKTGNHHLIFEFGGQTDDAYNAAVSWDGGGDGSSWSDALNWSGDSVPGAADDVTIDSTVTVNIAASTTINSLTLGNTNSPTLNFSYDAITNGALIIDDGDLTVGSNATVTHTAGAASVAGTVYIDVQTGNATISGNINVNQKGLTATNGTGAGGSGGESQSGGGAGYGSIGGDATVSLGGSAYGNMTAPVDVGSGGGNGGGTGGQGGGAIRLNIAGTVTVSGSITANGGNGTVCCGGTNGGGGGGSGGSVYITSATLAGNGTIAANGGAGGNGSWNGGGGGGGRIALYYTTKTYSGSIVASGGNAYDDGEIGGAAPIYLKPSGQTNPDITLDNGTITGDVDSGDFAETVFSGTSTFETFTIKNYASVSVTGTVTATTINLQDYGHFNNASGGTTNYTTFNWTTNGIITDNGGTLDLLSSGGDLTIPATTTLRTVATRTFNSLTINGTLTHPYNSTTETYKINYTINNDLTISATGTVDLDERGYTTASGTGAGSNDAGSLGGGGGGYGGTGGDSSGGISGGSTYGSSSAPVNIGSGGGNSEGTGGKGGGAVRFTVNGNTSVSGTITANGGDGTAGSGGTTHGAGGGSGGSIYIDTGTALSGSGTIRANGGNGGNGNSADGGGGGGGRVAIYYTSSTYSGTATASGGTGPDSAQDGSSGTVVTNGAPAATTPSSISQATDASGYITFSTTISDTDSEDTKLKVEYSDDGGTTWYDPDLVSATPSSGTVDLDDAQTYQIGSVDAIDTSTGDITLTIVWDTQSASNGNGSLDNTDQSDIKVRVTPNDSTADGTAQASSSFEVDNLDPSGLASLAASSYTSTTVSLSWTAATETNFNHYEIWYGTTQADVESRGGTASEWDNSDDANLATVSTSATTITGLTEGSTYYLRIWAIDDYGNEMNSSTVSQASNNKPSASTPTSISQATDGSGYITFSTTISDSDSQDTKLKVEYSDDNGSTWYDPVLVSATPSSGTTDLSNAQTYQIGSVNAIDTSGGNITLTIVWNTQSASNGNGSLDDTDQTDIKVRVTSNDSIEDGSASASTSFEVDNLDPSGLDNLSVTGYSSTTASLSWTAATETNFNHYEIWYGTSATTVENRSASEWDNDNDTNLATRTTTSTTVTGLTAGNTYYFRAWAVDDYGNEADNGNTVSTVTNQAPSATIPSSISQYTDSSGYLSFKTTISDADGDNTRVKVEYSDDNGTNWYDPYLVSVSPSSGITNLDNSNTYQIGSTNGIDTSSANITLTIVWNTQSSANGNGSLDNTDQTDIRIRVTPNDSAVDGTSQTSSTFEVDNLDPTGLSDLAVDSYTASSVKLTWDKATEANFNHYEIWYGTNKSNVQNRSASEWDNDNDSNLATLTTTDTTITSLTQGETYYFKIWAVDSYGNETTTAYTSQTTNSAPSASQPENIIQFSDGSGDVLFETTVSDDDGDVLDLEFQCSFDGGSTWQTCTVTSVVDDNGESVDPDSVDTSSGPVALHVTLDLDPDPELRNIVIRIGANDGAAEQTSDPSQEQEIDNQPPEVVENIAIKIVDEASAEISFDPSTDPNILQYIIYYDVNEVDIQYSASIIREHTSSTQQSVTLPNLSHGVTYCYKIAAVDAYGNVTLSPASCFETNRKPSAPVYRPPTAGDAGWINDDTPTFDFVLSDEDSEDQVKYQIEIDDSSDFNNPIVNYTSSLLSQGDNSFTVGQGSLGGLYSAGGTSTRLAEGEYFFRVRTIDSYDTTGPYVAAEPTGIRFKIDITPPTVPGAPTTQSPTPNKKPRWSWNPSTDGYAGLWFYTIQWSNSPDFHTETANTTDPDYTHLLNLDEGTWYIRAKATDKAGNESAWSETGTVVVDQSAEQTLPIIENVSYSLTSTSIDLGWETNVDTIYTLDWGPQNYNNTETGSTYATTHSQLLENLTPKTDYYIKITAYDIYNQSTSTSFTLTTPAEGEEREEEEKIKGIIAPTIITDVKLSFDELTQVTISWNTNHPATSEINYGLTPDFTNQVKDTTKTTDHALTLTNLKAGTTYHYEIISVGQTTAIKDNQTFTTPTNFVQLHEYQRVEEERQLKEQLENIDSPVGTKTIELIAKTPIVGTDLAKPALLLVQQAEEKQVPSSTVAVTTTAALLPTLLHLLWIPWNTRNQISIFHLPSALMGMVRKRRDPWGVVFDSETKIPLDPAVITLIDKDNNSKQVITDLYGRYYFLVKPGKYKMKVNKSNYAFPSESLKDRDSFGPYEDLYFGEYLEVAKDEKVVRNIPLDPEGGDWNQQSKRRMGVAPPKKMPRAIYKLAKILYWAGFLWTLFVTLLVPSLYNILILALFLVLFVVQRATAQQYSWGVVKDHRGKPISNAVVRLTNLKVPEVKSPPLVTDETGRYNFLAFKGFFQVTVELEDKTGEYVEVFRSDPVRIKKDYGEIAFDISLP